MPAFRRWHKQGAAQTCYPCTSRVSGRVVFSTLAFFFLCSNPLLGALLPHMPCRSQEELNAGLGEGVTDAGFLALAEAGCGKSLTSLCLERLCTVRCFLFAFLRSFSWPCFTFSPLVTSLLHPLAHSE